MTDPKPIEPLPESRLTMLDGCIAWPVANGGIIRIDPFHIVAFGVSPAQNPGAANAAESHGWCVWADVGTDAPYQLWTNDKAKAMGEFARIQQSKMRH